MIELNFEKGSSLVPVIVQDAKTNEVLMLAYMNNEAWKKTLEAGKATYFSRSRNMIWIKGGTSGHFQIVKEILVDCDDDAIVLKIEQKGKGACHNGYKSCFYQKIDGNKLVIKGKKTFDPKEVY